MAGAEGGSSRALRASAPHGRRLEAVGSSLHCARHPRRRRPRQALAPLTAAAWRRASTVTADSTQLACGSAADRMTGRLATASAPAAPVAAATRAARWSTTPSAAPAQEPAAQCRARVPIEARSRLPSDSLDRVVVRCRRDAAPDDAALRAANSAADGADAGNTAPQSRQQTAALSSAATGVPHPPSPAHNRRPRRRTWWLPGR